MLNGNEWMNGEWVMVCDDFFLSLFEFVFSSFGGYLMKREIFGLWNRPLQFKYLLTRGDMHHTHKHTDRRTRIKNIWHVMTLDITVYAEHYALWWDRGWIGGQGGPFSACHTVECGDIPAQHSLLSFARWVLWAGDRWGKTVFEYTPREFLNRLVVRHPPPLRDTMLLMLLYNYDYIIHKYC